MSDATLVQRLGALAATASIDSLPDAVVRSVPQRVLDIVGICVRATTLDTSQAVLDHVGEQGGRAASSVVGLSDRVPAAAAAFANGVLAHSLDYDDTHLPSILHPSASVVPAALAAGEAAGASGAEVVAAVAAGIEIAVRLGMAGFDPDANDGIGQSVYFEHGQHATSICGAIGSAAAAAVLLGRAESGAVRTDRAAQAMAVAASMASGIIEANRTGGTVKRIHCGLAAQAGVTAAQLVARGLTGAPTALEGRFGFFQAWLRDEWRIDAVTDGLDADGLDADGRCDTWSVADIFYKPYPANHFTHTGIDAALALGRELTDPLTPFLRDIRHDEAVSLASSGIASIHLGVSSPTVRTIGEPLEVKQRPETGYQAQFSGPYTVAAALLAGAGDGGSGLGLGLSDFTDDLARDPARRALMAKVTVGADARCDEIYPSQFPAVLTVTLTDGRVFERFVPVNRGGPANPLSDDELARKFDDNVAGLITPEAADAVRVACLDLAAAPVGAAVPPILTPLAELA